MSRVRSFKWKPKLPGSPLCADEEPSRENAAAAALQRAASRCVLHELRQLQLRVDLRKFRD